MPRARIQISSALAMPQSARLREVPPPLWRILSGHDQLISLQPQLAALAERCGQSGSMNDLDYFLSVPYFGSKLPHPLIQHFRLPGMFFARRSKIPIMLVQSGPDGLSAAVLLHQYHLYGVPTSAFVSADNDGWRTVIAPRERRAGVAKEAAELLLKKRASVVVVTFNEGLNDTSVEGSEDVDPLPNETATNIFSLDSPMLAARRAREFGHMLKLEATYDATLATMGAHTRRNLRALERKVVKELGAEFVPCAELSLSEFLALNRICTHAVPDWVAEWRYEASKTVPGRIFAGLRAADGRWVSLIGGRRHRDKAWIYWQMNLESSGALSLVTAMRSFLIAHEISLGVRSIRFEGGTAHYMNRSFQPERVTDLVFARRGMSPRLLRLIGRLLPAMACWLTPWWLTSLSGARQPSPLG